MTYVEQKNSWGRFDFLGASRIFGTISVILTFGAILLMAVKGLNYGVDFTGGIEVQIQFKQDVDPAQVRSFVADIGFPNANVQSIGGEREFLINIEMPEAKSEAETNTYITGTVAKVTEGLNAKFQGAEVRQVNTVGPQIGKELRRNGSLAAFYCFLLILVYIGLRFDYRYASAAVFCLVHDAAITLGIYSLLEWEFTVQTMAAILTIVGYSLNDTIVIFDRIRENRDIHRDKDLYWISNRSINETLSRTILTYVLTFFSIISMYIFADGAIKDFALTMLIGTFLGVVSTVYVATPLMIITTRWSDMRRARIQQAAYSGGK